MAMHLGHISLLMCLQLYGGGLAVRRVLCLPSGTHCNLLSLLNESMPVSLDVCKRSARFILSCLKPNSKVIRLVASFGVFGRHESIIGSNAISCCSQFNWNFTDFDLSTVDS